MMDSDARVGPQYDLSRVRREGSKTHRMKQAKQPLHFALPVAPENPIDLQMTAAVPGVKPLLQIASHTPPMLISGRPWPSIDGEPSSEIKRTAPCDAPASSDAVQYTTVSKAWAAHESFGCDHMHSSTLHSEPEHIKSAMACKARARRTERSRHTRNKIDSMPRETLWRHTHRPHHRTHMENC